MLGLDVCPYEVPPHIPEYRPFRMQTKHFHVIIHTLFPSLPIPPLTLHLTPATSTFLQADTQSSTLLRFRCPNHLNLPRLTTSATLCTPRRSTLHFLSFSDTPHIHLTIIHSVLSRLCRFAFFIAQVSVPYVNTYGTETFCMSDIQNNNHTKAGIPRGSAQLPDSIQIPSIKFKDASSCRCCQNCFCQPCFSSRHALNLERFPSSSN